MSFADGFDRGAQSGQRRRQEQRASRLDNFNLFNSYVTFAAQNGLALEPERIHNIATSISGGSNLLQRSQPTPQVASALSENLQREARALQERQREEAATAQLAERTAIMQTLSPLLMNNPSDQVLPQISRQFGEDFAADVGQRFDLPSLRQDAIDNRVREISGTDFFRNLRPSDIAGYYSGEPDDVRQGLSILSQRIEAQRQAAAAAAAASRQRGQFAEMADNPIIRDRLNNDDLDGAARIAERLYGVDRSAFEGVAPDLRLWNETNYAISAPPAPSANVTNLFAQGNVTAAFQAYSRENPGTHPNLPQDEAAFEQLMRGPMATASAGQAAERREAAIETADGIMEQNRTAAVDAGISAINQNASTSNLEAQTSTASRAMLMILGDRENATDMNYYVDPMQQEEFSQAVWDAIDEGMTAAEIAEAVPRRLGLQTRGDIRQEFTAAQMAERGLTPVGSVRQAEAIVGNANRDHEVFLAATVEDDPAIQEWQSDADAAATIAGYRANEQALARSFATRAEMVRNYAIENPSVADAYLAQAEAIERQGAEVQAHIANLIEGLQRRREAAFAAPSPQAPASPASAGDITRQDARHGREGGSLQYVPAPGTEGMTREERAQAARQGQLLGSWQWVPQQ